MKKRILFFLCLLLVFSCFSGFYASAEETAYSQQYEISGADRLEEYLDDDTRRFFDEGSIDPSDYNWVNNISGKGVFTHIGELVTGGMARPFRCLAAMLGVILITAAVTSFGEGGQGFMPAVYASTLAVAALIANDVWGCVSAANNAVKGCATFMLSFVPIYAAIVALSGGAVTAASMSTLLLAAAEGVAAAASYAVLPLMGGYLGMSICTGISPAAERSDIPQTVKKLSMWVMSLVSTVFVGILGIQTAVNSSADGLAAKTARFILGTSVPVAGGVLADAVTTVSASVGLLRSSIGIYGVVAICIMMLPIVIEIVLWRAVMLISASVSDFFSLAKISSVLKAVDAMLSVLLGVTLLTAAMFIISLTVVVTSGRAQ